VIPKLIEILAFSFDGIYPDDLRTIPLQRSATATCFHLAVPPNETGTRRYKPFFSFQKSILSQFRNHRIIFRTGLLGEMRMTLFRFWVWSD